MKMKIAKGFCVIAICLIVLGSVALTFADGEGPANPGDPEPDLPLTSTLSPTACTLGEVANLILLSTVHLWL